MIKNCLEVAPMVKEGPCFLGLLRFERQRSGRYSGLSGWAHCIVVSFDQGRPHGALTLMGPCLGMKRCCVQMVAHLYSCWYVVGDDTRFENQRPWSGPIRNSLLLGAAEQSGPVVPPHCHRLFSIGVVNFLYTSDAKRLE